MIRLALKMLFGDHAKYLMLISGITFATLLITQGAALFCGIMSWTYSPLRNVRADIWVADTQVQQVNDSKPMRDIELQRVRSVDGVAWAAALYQGANQARLLDGGFKFVTVVGLDPTTLAGAPTEITAGRLDDIRLPNSVILDEFGVSQFSEQIGRPISVGDAFEINDHEARLVAVCKSQRSFTGGPFVFTTYDRVSGYSPGQRKQLSFVLAEPVAGQTPEQVARQIERETGLRAFTQSELLWSTVFWFVKNTGIPINIGLIVAIGLVVGIAISGQTFYSFIMENSRNLAALKAMGASTLTLCAMVVAQSLAVGFVGLGIGLGLVTALGHAVLRLNKVPFLMLWQIPAATSVAVLLICLLAALLGIVRIVRLEPAAVFR
ncbi:MAG: ABC transporter permease [Tepidisphaeraceae bacterium]